MQETRIACPNCGKRLKTTDTVQIGSRFRCPKCQQPFHVPTAAFLPVAALETLYSPDVTLPPATVPNLALPSVPTVPELQPWGPSAQRPGGARTGLIAGSVFCIVALGAGLAIGLSGGKKDQDDPKRVADGKKYTQEEKRTEPKQEEPIRLRDLLPEETTKDRDPPRKVEDGEGDTGRLKPPPDLRRVERDPPPPPNRSTLSAEKQEKVNQAIDRGVAFLRKQQHGNGSWLSQGQHALSQGQHALGLAALPGLTLIECGVAADDPAVQKALAYVRANAPSNLLTYDISLAILFLDRVGDRKDRRLIQKLALRLMAGQQPSGGWTYHCRDVFSPDEELALYEQLQQTRPKSPQDLFERDKGDAAMAFIVDSLPKQEMTTARLELPNTAVMTGLHFASGVPRAVGTITSTSPNAAAIPLEQLKPSRTKLDDLPPKLKNLPLLKPTPRAQDLPARDITDNSNTQFGILGIWAAARHGIPMEKTLALMVKRFRKSQNADGSWGYHFVNGGGSPGSAAMNGVGLLGLAVGHGLIAGIDSEKAKSVLKDPAIEKGLKALTHHLDADVPPPIRGAKRNPRQLVRAAASNCYFLWTVERVGILYNLTKIGECNWYEWCVDVLLPRQLADGHWAPGLGGYTHADTCQALLVLKRANLTRDLTARINSAIPVREKKDD